MITVGVDLSINSPGLCIHDGTFFEHYFFLHTKKTKSLPLYSKNKRHRFESIPYPSWSSREQRFDKVTDELVSKITKHTQDGTGTYDGNPPRFKIFIEGYAFLAKGKTHDIAENGGLFRHKIMKAGLGSMVEIAPTSVKKQFTGSGKANKTHMESVFKDKTGIDLFKLFGRRRSEKGNVPSPLQDIVDAYALVEINLPGRSPAPSLAKILIKKLRKK